MTTLHRLFLTISLLTTTREPASWELPRLQELIGAEAFDRGLMPPCLPGWRMTEIR